MIKTSTAIFNGKVVSIGDGTIFIGHRLRSLIGLTLKFFEQIPRLPNIEIHICWQQHFNYNFISEFMK
jgi:hypothetical protein